MYAIGFNTDDDLAIKAEKNAASGVTNVLRLAENCPIKAIKTYGIHEAQNTVVINKDFLAILISC